jgi:glycosyltransferase involved in cell wall biosynthesis
LSIKVLARERIDVVQFCQPPDMYFPLAPLFRRAGARVLVDQRDLTPELYAARYGEPGRGLRRALRTSEKLSLRSADHIVCVNKYFRERALAASGVPPASISVVGNGPVLARVDAATPDESLKRGHKHLACWVGEIGRQDRVDLLIRSVHHVVRELGRTDTLFAVIGDGECLPEAKSLVHELGVGDWVHFPGFLSYDQVFQYLATADIGLDAGLQFEVSPVKAIEYMAAGLPQVAFDLPETRALAEGAALFAKPGDIVEHAQNIDALLADQVLREELGNAGRRRVRDELAWERQAVTYVETVARVSRLRARHPSPARG